MFNLNKNNRIVMLQHPSDMRIGVLGTHGRKPPTKYDLNRHPRLSTFASKIIIMMSREEFLSIEQYCSEHNVTHKQRLAELNIPF